MREARLKPEYSDRYPGIPAGEWMPVGVLIDRLTAQLLLQHRAPGGILQGRVLEEDHFEFRGSSARPGDRPPDRSRRTDV